MSIHWRHIDLASSSPGPADTDKLIPALYVEPPYIACVVVAVPYNRTTESRDPGIPYQSHLAAAGPVRTKTSPEYRGPVVQKP